MHPGPGHIDLYQIDGPTTERYDMSLHCSKQGMGNMLTGQHKTPIKENAYRKQARTNNYPQTKSGHPSYINEHQGKFKSWSLLDYLWLYLSVR